MTRAQAPGKVVISGAYAVLHGAPAIASAVTRYVVADSSRPAELVTPEVAAALAAAEQAPWFDASALREGGRKLGLGSSAAILVASLYALESAAYPASSAEELRARVLQRAFAAHRTAQGGGSGIDVAASVRGGVLGYQLTAAGPRSEALALPAELVFEVWSCPVAASTRELLAAVAALGRRDPASHARHLEQQARAAEQAYEASKRADASGFVAALAAQQRALLMLGSAAGVPIVTPDLAELAPLAEAQGAALLPAGAGGGDIALFVGTAPASAELRRALQGRAHQRLALELGAAGVSVA